MDSLMENSKKFAKVNNEDYRIDLSISDALKTEIEITSEIEKLYGPNIKFLKSKGTVDVSMLYTALFKSDNDMTSFPRNVDIGYGFIELKELTAEAKAKVKADLLKFVEELAARGITLPDSVVDVFKNF